LKKAIFPEQKNNDFKMNYIIRNLSIGEGETAHLCNVNLELPTAGVVTIIGRTLAGKTTLLKVMAGLQAVDSGTFYHNGKDLLKTPAWKRRVGMVYQQFVNYPHLNVRDNIAFPLRRSGMGRDEIEQKLEYVSTLLGLGDYMERRPDELSGGQQQRVALARSLVKDSYLLLLDEPLVNLDYKLREQLREEFRRLFKDSKDRLVVYATTEPDEAMILQGHVVVLHEGRVIQAGPCADVYHYPANIISAKIFNDPPMNMFGGTIADGLIQVAGGLSIKTPSHLKDLAPGSYVFGIRAIDVKLGGKAASADLVLAEVNGSTTVLHLDMDGQNMVLEMQGVHHFDTAARVDFSLLESRLYAFDTERGELLAAPLIKSLSGQGGLNGKN